MIEVRTRSNHGCVKQVERLREGKCFLCWAKQKVPWACLNRHFILHMSASDLGSDVDLDWPLDIIRLPRFLGTSSRCTWAFLHRCLLHPPLPLQAYAGCLSSQRVQPKRQVENNVIQSPSSPTISNGYTPMSLVPAHQLMYVCSSHYGSRWSAQRNNNDGLSLSKGDPLPNKYA